MTTVRDKLGIPDTYRAIELADDNKRKRGTGKDPELRRSMILQYLKERDSATIAELAPVADLSLQAVRYHLVALEKEGKVYRRKKGQSFVYRLGRPAVLSEGVTPAVKFPTVKVKQIELPEVSLQEATLKLISDKVFEFITKLDTADATEYGMQVQTLVMFVKHLAEQHKQEVEARRKAQEEMTNERNS